MHYIIIGFIAICIICVVMRFVLFEPRINSAIFLLYFAYVLDKVKVGRIFFIILISIGMFDCVWDIIMSKKYYESIDICIDKFYLIKSLTSLFTLGFARIIFFLIVNPVLHFRVMLDIKKRMKIEQPLPYPSFYSNTKIKNYYYEKQVDKLEKEGMIISNKKTVDHEVEIRRDKLDKLYPQKIMDKIVDMVAGDKEIKEKREKAEQKLRSMEVCYAFLRTDLFAKYPGALIEVMSKKGRYSVSVIKTFSELGTLNLLYPVTENTKDRLTEWSEFFIIQALQPLVAQGIFEDDDFNDNDAMDNHAYQYVESKVSMPSINADEDPRFALDDD